MLPDQGIVVMSVGNNAVSVARITAMGDHANVENLQLLSQR